MTAAVVEALSFASLTTLLASPPQYPRNPTHEVREPLVLYIVRVPGSKDLVLTPWKPPTKASVNLDAIQSCLYYLHVETPEDEVVRQSMETELRAFDQNRPPPTSVQRKPLPRTVFANFPPSRRPPTPPKSYPHYQPAGTNGDSQYDRYAARGSNIKLGSERENRPFGARPMPSRQDAHENPNAAKISTPFEALNPPKLAIPADLGTMPLQQDFGTVGVAQIPEISPVAGSGNLVTITLIRRDPTSGAQWNVGTIRVSARRHSLSLLQPVQVVLSAPGYNRFADTPSSASPLKRMSVDCYSNSSTPNEKRFTRHVGFTIMPEDQRTTLHDIRTKSNEFEATSGNGANVTKPRQVFSFTSPWQGICIFSKGVDGKSLKLRHSLTAHRGTEAEQGNAVAELRFNLPWSVLRLKDTLRQSVTEPEKLPISQLLGKSKKEQWRRSMQHFRQDSKQFLRNLREDKESAEQTRSVEGPAAVASLQSVEDDSRISLRLGREKAGGGFKGDSAKLGKLILEDEGLKMGDLVVACCMGVFWQHQEG